MITATKLRNGVTFEDGGEPWRVIEYKHAHMSRGAGNVKVKCRNLLTGRTLSKAFKGGDKVNDISVSKQPLQYLYNDGEDYFFMNPRTFEQVSINAEVLGEDVAYLKEGSEVSVLYWDEQALTVDLPPKMTFIVAEAAPGEKGNSASNVYKDAVLENGLSIRVPLFINAGDTVRVDTRDGSYIERAN